MVTCLFQGMNCAAISPVHPPAADRKSESRQPGRRDNDRIWAREKLADEPSFPASSLVTQTSAFTGSFLGTRVRRMVPGETTVPAVCVARYLRIAFAS